MPNAQDQWVLTLRDRRGSTETANSGCIGHAFGPVMAPDPALIPPVRGSFQATFRPMAA